MRYLVVTRRPLDFYGLQEPTGAGPVKVSPVSLGQVVPGFAEVSVANRAVIIEFPGHVARLDVRGGCIVVTDEVEEVMFAFTMDEVSLLLSVGKG